MREETEAVFPLSAACMSEAAFVPGVLVAKVVNITRGLEYENLR